MEPTQDKLAHFSSVFDRDVIDKVRSRSNLLTVEEKAELTLSAKDFIDLRILKAKYIITCVNKAYSNS